MGGWKEKGELSGWGSEGIVLEQNPMQSSIVAELTTVIGVAEPPKPGQSKPESISWNTLTGCAVSTTVVVVTAVVVEVDVVEVVKMVVPVVTVVVVKRETVEGDATHEHA
jgi:hypothetical protein